MMKNYVLGLMGVMLVIFMLMSCQKGEKVAGSTVEGKNVPKETASKIILSSEDSMLCVEVFESYLDYEE